MPVHINSLLPQGHYRAGKHHSPEGKAWDESDFTPAEWIVLRSDPNLMVGDECAPDGDWNGLAVDAAEAAPAPEQADPAPIEAPEAPKAPKRNKAKADK
ncbi:hypothetical protein LJC46_02140 [Desulfovibrio sp. OttesenSCG-928-G15]|nr:hypothetical protein [Desulfovibrio sp. OttesenSCG-928-G15]